MLGSQVLDVANDTFRGAVADGLRVIDFWVGWCGPCRLVPTQLEAAAQQRPQCMSGKVDVDAEPALAGYDPRSIPTLIVFRDSEAIGVRSGVVGAGELIGAPRSARRRSWSGDEPMTSGPEWSLERALVALAGTFTLLSAGLSAVGSKRFLLLTAMVGVNQWLYVLKGWCPASLILRRAYKLQPAAEHAGATNEGAVTPR